MAYQIAQSLSQNMDCLVLLAVVGEEKTRKYNVVTFGRI
jgi:hypothetical protein